MKNIIGYFKDYFKTEFHLGLFLTVGIFLAAALSFNYAVSFDSRVIDSFRKENIQILIYLAYYALPYFFVLFACVIFTGKKDFLKKRGFWATILFALLILSLNSWFWQYSEWVKINLPVDTRYFWIKTLYNLKRFVIIGGALLIFRRLFDRELESFYGLTRRNFNPRPYFIILMVVIPGIFAISFTPDFIQAYPSYKPGRAEAFWKISNWLTVPPYEFLYGIDFATAEVFFRGFLVIGMVKWLGKGAILPMVGVYCFLHFGKPMGEAISSVFGGFALGVIAYYSRSVLGGIILHIGVAWSMDFFAHLQNYVFR